MTNAHIMNSTTCKDGIKKTYQPNKSAPAASLGRPKRNCRCLRFCWFEMMCKPAPGNSARPTSIKEPMPRAAIGLYSSGIFSSSVDKSNIQSPSGIHYGSQYLVCPRQTYLRLEDRTFIGALEF